MTVRVAVYGVPSGRVIVRRSVVSRRPLRRRTARAPRLSGAVNASRTPPPVERTWRPIWTWRALRLPAYSALRRASTRASSRALPRATRTEPRMPYPR